MAAERVTEGGVYGLPPRSTSTDVPRDPCSDGVRISFASSWRVLLRGVVEQLLGALQRAAAPPCST